MLKFFIFLGIIVTLEFSHAQFPFVTLWTPKFVRENASYRLFIFPTHITKPTEVAVQFRKTSASYMLTNGKLNTVEFPSQRKNFGNISSFDILMTLYRNFTTSSGVQMRCSTRSIPVETKTGNFYNFIQTDKPIYKPGDVVQFRVLTVDKDLLPFHRNSINVTVSDPAGRKMYNFMNQAGKYIGVFDDNFTLSTETSLGDWMITVIVDKKVQMATSKIFAVQKYKFPLFDAKIDLADQHVLQNDEIIFSIYGKYSFGEYVKGNAELIIRRASDKFEYSNEKFTNIQQPRVVRKNLQAIGVQTSNELKLEAFLVFTEPQSGTHFNKTVEFYVHNNQQNKLIAVHNEKYLPGLPFTIKVYIYNWKNEQLLTHPEKIEVIYSFKTIIGTNGNLFSHGQLQNGIFVHEFFVPFDYMELSVEVKFPNSDIYRAKLEKGSVNVGINSLMVSHLPVNPKIYQQVKIYVTSDRELYDIIMAVVTRNGNIKTQQISCNRKLICDFEVEVKQDMMPHSTIIVYDIKNSHTIFQGQTTIVTEDLGRNHLTIDLPTRKIINKERVNIKIATKPQSKVYLLAYDKRFKSLKDGNDITKDDVVKSVADYDGENKILIHIVDEYILCTPEEIERLQNGRNVVHQKGTDTYYPDEPDDEDDDAADISLPDTNNQATDKNLFRERFPDTWIFETIDMGSRSSIDQVFITPDSMTTWLVSAFSVNNDDGIAIVPQQELPVMKEVFVELKLPYSIRYTEVLKLEILVHNYVSTREQIHVDLKLNNLNNGKEFQFVDYSSSCSPSFHEGTVASSKFTVPAYEVKLVYFYIRSHPSNNVFDEQKSKLMALDVEVTATTFSGRFHRDHIRKQLIVDSLGMKVYKVQSDFFKLEGGIENSKFQPKANFSQGLSNIDVVVTGDFLTDLMDFETQITINPSASLQSKVTKFKRNVDTFPYLNIKNIQLPKGYYIDQYQGILKELETSYNYRDTPWFRSYLGDALATAMSHDAIPQDKKTLFETLDMVRDQQESNGTFSYFKIYYFVSGTILTESFNYTERYFGAAFCMIPILKHKSLLDGRYNGFLEKGFRYLDKDENRLLVMRYGLSVAAYAYALDGQFDKAEDLLNEIEKVYFVSDKNRKCYKVFENDTECDTQHTSYVALTYLVMNDMIRAKPTIHYLMERKHIYKENGNDLNLGFATDPVAVMAVALHSDKTNLNVIIRNDHTFEKKLHIDDQNSVNSHTFAMPKGSKKIKSSVSGQGYCTVSVIFERIVYIPQVIDIFSTDIRIIYGTSNPRESVQVCGTYNHQMGMKTVLANVVYEVEMPSGYEFFETLEGDVHPEVREIVSRRHNTLVNVYFNDFEADKKYCVTLRMAKVSVVNEPSNAGVKIYDYNNKDHMAIDFYKIPSNVC